MRSWPLAFAVALGCLPTVSTVPAAATATPEPSAKTPEVSSEPVVLEGFVVLAAGAVLTNAAGQTVTLPVSEEVWGYAFRLEADAGDTLEVATYLEPFKHCTVGLDWYGGVDLRFTARRTDLLTVLAEEVTAKYADGTSLRLRPGSLIRHDAPRPVVDASGIRLPVELSARNLGLSYRTSDGFEMFPMKGDVDAGAPLVLDGRPMENPQGLYPALGVENRFAMFGMKPRDEETVQVVVRSACAELEVIVPATAAKEGKYGALKGTGLGGSLGGTIDPASPTLRVLPKGTTLTWTDGSEAGTVISPVLLNLDDSADPVCLPQPKGSQGDKAPKVCAPRSAFETVARPESP